MTMLNDNATWQPYKEPFGATLVRNSAIALAVGAVLAWQSGGLARWPIATLVLLWPTFGGHFVELWFLNVLRPRLPAARAVHIAVRLMVWFVGGSIVALGTILTAMVLSRFRSPHWAAWWLGGIAFIGIELLANLALQLRGRPSFYNGRG
jgi:hypothetical protein